MITDREPPQEAKPSRWRRILVPAAAAGAIILPIVILGTIVEGETNKPLKTLESDYTGDGKCLDGSPYDPNEGAIVNINSTDVGEVVSVTPLAANTFRPSVLLFDVEEHTYRPSLIYAGDTATAGLLAQYHCPGSEGGL